MAFQRTDTGYDVTAAKRPVPPGENGWLSFIRGDEQPLWVYEVQTGFSLSGSTAQSVSTRTYFPRNFNQPILRIMCQAPSQEIYGQTAEFVRRSHLAGIVGTLTELKIVSRGVTSPAIQNNKTLKGAHQAIIASGYITAIRRDHERFIPAPDFAFDFTVAEFKAPSGWADTPVVVSKLKKLHHISSIVDSLMNKNGMRSDPDSDFEDLVPDRVPDLPPNNLGARTS